MNTNNRRKDLDRIDRVEGPARLISEVEVKTQLEKMKNRKATGPDRGSEESGTDRHSLDDGCSTGHPSKWYTTRMEKE